MPVPCFAPDVSVVITTRNRRVWLEESLASVLGQDGPAFEVLVVDDASSDDTWPWLQAISDSRVRAVRLGIPSERAVARNTGLADARGRRIMFLDDDDTLWRGALEVLAAGLDRHPDAIAAVGARQVWFADEDYRRRDAHPRVSGLRDVTHDLLVGWSSVSGQNLYRTESVRRAGGFNHQLIPCEDRDLWLRLALLGPVVLQPQVVMTYRMHPAQWRPDDIRRIRETVAQTAILALPEGKRGYALRLRRTTGLLDRAEDALSAGSMASGVVCAAQAFASSPAIFASPLVGEWVLRRLLGRVARRIRPVRPGRGAGPAVRPIESPDRPAPDYSQLKR